MSFHHKTGIVEDKREKSNGLQGFLALLPFTFHDFAALWICLVAFCMLGFRAAQYEENLLYAILVINIAMTI